MSDDDTGDQMPSSKAAEKAILSSLMKNPERLFKRLVSEGIDDECFYMCNAFWTELSGYIESKPDLETDGSICIISFITHLQANGRLANVGGSSEVVEISNYAYSAAGWSNWVVAVREAKARRIAIGASKLISEANDSSEAIEAIEKSLEEIKKAVATKTASRLVKDLLPAYIDDFKSRKESGKSKGDPSGVDELDKVNISLSAGDLFTVGGKSSRGKSVLMLQIAANYILQGKKVLILSLEMMEVDILNRFVCFLGGVAYDIILNPETATKGDLLKFRRGIEILNESYVRLDCSGGQTLASIENEAQMINDAHGIDLIVVDYLQLISSPPRSRENREREVARASGGLKQLAKNMKCPVITASQLNKEGGTRESEAIIQDSDVLLIICDDGVKVAKNRNGERDIVVPLFLNGRFQRFENQQYQNYSVI
jgi:replicative DNA helicase